jgi:hypothetical protein
MQILAIAGVFGAFALVCFVIYVVGQSLQRRGRDLTFVDPGYPDSMQAASGKVDIRPPDSADPQDNTSRSETRYGSCQSIGSPPI